MLVYVNYYNQGYTSKQIEIRNALKPFEVKVRTNPSWPGTLNTECPNTDYAVVFYEADEKTKPILKSVARLSDWSRPFFPEDLAFFKNNICWFYSVGHEEIAAIIHADDSVMKFIEDKKLANPNNAFVPDDNYFDQYDENLIV